MFEYRDLFRWDRFITPTLIKPFFGVMIGFVVLMGLSGIFSGLTAMAINPFGGFIIVVASLVGVVAGIMFSRVISEFVLIAFRINEHLGAIREYVGQERDGAIGKRGPDGGGDPACKRARPLGPLPEARRAASNVRCGGRG